MGREAWRLVHQQAALLLEYLYFFYAGCLVQLFLLGGRGQHEHAVVLCVLVEVCDCLRASQGVLSLPLDSQLEVVAHVLEHRVDDAHQIDDALGLHSRQVRVQDLEVVEQSEVVELLEDLGDQEDVRECFAHVVEEVLVQELLPLEHEVNELVELASDDPGGDGGVLHVSEVPVRDELEEVLEDVRAAVLFFDLVHELEHLRALGEPRSHQLCVVCGVDEEEVEFLDLRDDLVRLDARLGVWEGVGD